MRHAVVEQPWIAVHLQDTGTHLGPWGSVAPTGRAFTNDEFAMYRVEDERIVEVWVTADNARLPRG